MKIKFLIYFVSFKSITQALVKQRAKPNIPYFSSACFRITIPRAKIPMPSIAAMMPKGVNIIKVYNWLINFCAFRSINKENGNHNCKNSSYCQKSKKISHNFFKKMKVFYFSSACFRITTPRAKKPSAAAKIIILAKLVINYNKLISLCILLSIIKEKTKNASTKQEPSTIFKMGKELIFCTNHPNVARHEAIKPVKYNLNRFNFSLIFASLIIKKSVLLKRLSVNFIIINLLSLLLLTNIVNASSTHCDNFPGSYNFYCNEKSEEEDKPETPQQNIKEGKTDEWYLQKIQEITKTVEVKKAKAILEPTEENIRDYISYQREVINMASTFGEKWQKVLWKNPDLDYSLERPVSQTAKETYLDNRKQTMEATLKELSKDYGIFFIFKSNCSYCHKFAPTLKFFSLKYGFKISPVSLDGGYLSEFPKEKTLINKGELQKMGIQIKAVPATILFDSKTKEVIEIGFGLLSLDEIEERVFFLTNKR